MIGIFILIVFVMIILNVYGLSILGIHFRSDTFLKEYSDNPLLDLKGEMVIIIDGNKKETSSADEVLDKVNMLIKEKGYSAKEAISVVALIYDISKNELYNAYLKQQ